MTDVNARWRAQRPVVCDEVRGLVSDAATGRAVSGAAITVDGTSLRSETDSLGAFPLRLTAIAATGPEPARPVTLRIRSIGKVSVIAALPDLRGYVVEATLASAAFHADEVSTVRVRGPATCQRAP